MTQAGFNQVERDRWVTALAATVPPGSRVLDVGAGRAPYRPLFAHCDYRTQDFGQEPSTVGHYAPLDYVSDICAIPVEAGSFDVVICTEVLEHVPRPIDAIAEMARVLRPGGRLMLTAPLGSVLHQEPYHFYGGFTPYFYEHAARTAGLRMASIEPNRGFFSLLGQEVQRFAALAKPWRGGLAWYARPAVALLWASALPFALLLPSMARWLDGLGLERVATVGYHVVCEKA